MKWKLNKIFFESNRQKAIALFFIFSTNWQSRHRRKSKSSECKFEKICIAVTLKKKGS